MFMNGLNVEALIESADNTELESVNLQDILLSSRKNIGSILDLIDLELKHIELEARYHCARWWRAFDENLKKESPDSSYLGTRVRRVNDSLVIEWHIRKPAKGAGKDNYYAKYLKKGSSERYSDRIFDKEPEWAQTLGKEIEDSYEVLRSRSKRLGAMKKSITYYLRLS